LKEGLALVIERKGYCLKWAAGLLVMVGWGELQSRFAKMYEILIGLVYGGLYARMKGNWMF
jgi:hypothetical protein